METDIFSEMLWIESVSREEKNPSAYPETCAFFRSKP